MKLYVDELPKNCKDCKFQCFGECLNGADILNCDYNSMKCHLKRGKVKDCPLQSLANYTKQARKELIDKLALFLIETFSKDAEFSVEEILNWFQEVKHQIQGETNRV